MCTGLVAFSVAVAATDTAAATGGFTAAATAFVAVAIA